jgi:hypothetical protein
MWLVALSMLASTIMPPAPTQAQTAAAKSAMATGTVKSVTTQSLVVVSGGKDMTFTVDGTTKFIGKGLSTQSAKNKIMAPDAVRVDDRVRVTYREIGGTMHAASVRVTDRRQK